MKNFIKIFFSILLIICVEKNLFAIENKILLKVDSEIITSLDIYNEIKFLTILNPELKNLNKEEIFEISKNSIIRDIVRKKEILNNSVKFEVDKNYINKIIQSNYLKRNIKNLDELKMFLLNNEIDNINIEEKLKIEILWNELVYRKYSNKVKIDKAYLEKQLENFKNKKKTYQLSEILFNLDADENFLEKYNKIKNSINEIGFKNTASTYSISRTASSGGELGWLDENIFEQTVINKISKLNKGEHSEPIIVPGGFLILRVDNFKIVEYQIDKNKEIQELIIQKTNQQLNQLSIIYYNKVKKNIIINEL